MKVLVIDNIDSFVYNLVQYVGALGHDPYVLRNTASKAVVDEACSRAERIIVSPGPKAPKDAGISNYVIKEYGPKIPTLGVCLGHQCIGYVFGGRIVHARRMMHGKTSMIRHDGTGVLKGLPNPFEATRYHSLAVSEEGLPGELKVVATALDDGEIMALKHGRHPIYGVQFHPESILTKDGMHVMRNFFGGGI